MKKLLLATATLTALMATARADAFIVMGAGFMNCTQFAVLIRQAGPAGKVVEGNFFNWAQGLMSGINMGKEAMGQTAKNLTSIDIDRQQRILRGYCMAHPTKQYMDGVIDLLNQLDDAAGE